MLPEGIKFNDLTEIVKEDMLNKVTITQICEALKNLNLRKRAIDIDTHKEEITFCPYDPILVYTYFCPEGGNWGLGAINNVYLNYFDCLEVMKIQEQRLTKEELQ